jgi:hypothetical protein
MATRQPYLLILIEDPSRQRETLRELEASSPKVVVIDKIYPGAATDAAFMREWLREEYVMVREGSRYDVFARR